MPSNDTIRLQKKNKISFRDFESNMENVSIVDTLDNDRFSVSSCSSSGDGGNNNTTSRTSSTSNSDNERHCLNRRVRYRRRRIQHNNNSDGGGDSDRLSTLNNISNCGSFVVIDGSDLIRQCQNQNLCAHYKSSMDCVRLKRRRSLDTSDAPIDGELPKQKEQRSLFRRGYTAIRNSFNAQNSRRFRYMKSVVLSMNAAEMDADRNNNKSGNSLCMFRDYDVRKSSGDERVPYRRVTYVRDFSSSTACIGVNNGDDKATKRIRWVQNSTRKTKIQMRRVAQWLRRNKLRRCFALDFDILFIILWHSNLTSA